MNGYLQAFPTLFCIKICESMSVHFIIIEFKTKDGINNCSGQHKQYRIMFHDQLK